MRNKNLQMRNLSMRRNPCMRIKSLNEKSLPGKWIIICKWENKNLKSHHENEFRKWKEKLFCNSQRHIRNILYDLLFFTLNDSGSLILWLKVAKRWKQECKLKDHFSIIKHTVSPISNRIIIKVCVILTPPLKVSLGGQNSKIMKWIQILFMSYKFEIRIICGNDL